MIELVRRDMKKKVSKRQSLSERLFVVKKNQIGKDVFIKLRTSIIYTMSIIPLFEAKELAYGYRNHLYIL